MDIKAGYIIINKQEGLTSFSVVNKIKYLSKLKAGHTGTLDPLAKGVLPVLLGSATKLSSLIMEGKKEYIAKAIFGISTDTLDITGKVINEVDIKEKKINIDDLIKVLNSFIGVTKQVPPMYSALKLNGKKLYELAREGIEVKRESREITIDKIELLTYDFPNFSFKVSCSKGTYIRSLIDDIGRKLYLPCVMSDLTRTKTGAFNIESSVKLEDLNKENIFLNIKPIEDLFVKYDNIMVDEKVQKLLLNGVKINDKGILKLFGENTKYRISNEENKFLGLASKTDSELTMIYKV